MTLTFPNEAPMHKTSDVGNSAIQKRSHSSMLPLSEKMNVLKRKKPMLMSLITLM